MRRDWTLARAKVESERCCRVCQARERVQAAHTIGRTHDKAKPKLLLTGVTATLFVDPVDVVPLCERHHQAYDKRELDLLPFLTIEEQAAAVSHVGIISALRRLTGTRD